MRSSFLPVTTMALIALLALSVGCATPTSPPEVGPQGPAAAAVAIGLEMHSPIGFQIKATHVFFARLEQSDVEEKHLGNHTIYTSNYEHDGYYYLLNAPPGRYAMVAALRNTTDNKDERLQYWSYFPESMIEASAVAVAAGQLVYGGNFNGRVRVGFGGADEKQLYYKRFFSQRIQEIIRDLANLAEDGNIGGLLLYRVYDHGSSSVSSRVADALFLNKYHYRFEMASHVNDSATRSQFGLTAMPLLQAGGWGDHIATVSSETAPVSLGE